MPELIAAVAVAALIALIALVAWFAGSLALRVAGGVLLLVGLIGTATTSPAGLIVAGLGAVLWLAGHWLYGVRHHVLASPLARRLFWQTPLRRIDPTRGYGIPTVPPRSRRDPTRGRD